MIIIYGINTYNELCSEIEIANIRIEGLEGQKKEIMKLLGAPNEIMGMEYSDMPTGNKNMMSIDRLVDALYKIDNMLEIEQSLLKGMVATKVKINSKLKGLKGIEYQIVYKRDIENKSFIKISQELNYSVRQIYRIIGKVS